MRTSLFVFAVLLAACNVARTPDSAAGLDDLIADGQATNIALLTSALNNDEDDRWWSKNSIKELRSALKKIRGDDQLKITEKHDLTAPDLLALTTKAAKDVGTNGTLIWYVASHGWTDGFATAGGGRIRPADVMAALKAGRTKPIKRLVMLFDYCGSGGMVQGLGLTDGTPPAAAGADGGERLVDLAAMPKADALGRAFAEALADAGVSSLGLAGDGDMPLFETALFFSAAAPLQTTSGSIFTEGMVAAINDNADNPNYKIGKFLKDTAKHIGENETEEYQPGSATEFELVQQKAVYRALPTTALLNETLFSSED